MTEDKSRVKSDQYIQFIHMIEHVAEKRQREQLLDKTRKRRKKTKGKLSGIRITRRAQVN